MRQRDRCGGTEGKDRLPLLLDLADRTHTHTPRFAPFSLHKRSSAAAELVRIVSKREMESFPYGEPQENVTTSCFLWLISSRREGMTA